jgi:hypothetical protein
MNELFDFHHFVGYDLNRFSVNVQIDHIDTVVHDFKSFFTFDQLAFFQQYFPGNRANNILSGNMTRDAFA